jgi:hypothetical protein
MRWTRQRQAQSLRGRMMLSRTAKSCGPGAPTLALSSWTRTTGDGGKKARSPGRSRISRNTIVQGMPVDAVYPWLLTPVLSCCTGGLGCNAHPAFPAPSVEEGGTLQLKPRAKHAARSRSYAVRKPSCEEAKLCGCGAAGRRRDPMAGHDDPKAVLLYPKRTGNQFPLTLS